jgi:release factor glutamine methyltransferase
MIYQPAEDSFLIQTEVKRLAKGNVLDIGTGTGILANTAVELKKVKSVLGVDIKNEAVEHCRNAVKSKKAKFIASDLFAKVPKQQFDTIIFNPPYLPEQKGELWELSTDISGGKRGYEIIGRFLNDVNDYLAPDGIVLLLFSTITGKMKVESLIEQHMLAWEQMNKTNIAFEQLFVYKLTKPPLRKLLEKKGVTKIALLTKGHRGLIYTGMYKRQKIAVKAQRPDIDAEGTVDNEAVQLKELNKHKIGPMLLFSGKDVLAYKFIEGEFIMDYLARTDVKKDAVIQVLTNVFEQMFALDKLGLNKEEMTHPMKHIIVTKGNNAVLLDFERCKARKQAHNVTQFAQFVISGRIMHHLERLKIRINMLEMLKRTKHYSDSKTRENFEKILELLM